MAAESILALTSLPLGNDRAALHRRCIKSWRDAGLEVVSFNHASEIDSLRSTYDVLFVPVEETTVPIFGRHYVPIRAMLDWAVQQGRPMLLVNADVELRMTPWQMRRLRWLCDGGICYFVRFNYDRDMRRAVREAYGIDAFLFDCDEAALVPDSFLSMGQPFWDYWIPHCFAAAGRRVFAIESPVLFHQNHPRRWSEHAWHRCAHEFGRLSGLLCGDESMEACVAMSARVRQSFDARRTVLSLDPEPIRNWVERKFSYRGPKTFLELGAHDGGDTAWMAALPDSIVHAFEPDPRNRPAPRENVTVTRAAVSDRDGRAAFILSELGWGRPWTYSSSIKRPKNHLSRYPVTFGETIQVATVTLDSHCRQHDIGAIDFIWADIQGAEGEMIRGGRDTFARTRYLFTEYSDDELYEDQATLSDILVMLPGFRVLELWPDDVLLENPNSASLARSSGFQ